jgi:hypothetical protein
MASRAVRCPYDERSQIITYWSKFRGIRMNWCRKLHRRQLFDLGRKRIYLMTGRECGRIIDPVDTFI